eukprot:4784038-Amphidinium_carterae.4
MGGGALRDIFAKPRLGLKMVFPVGGDHRPHVWQGSTIGSAFQMLPKPGECCVQHISPPRYDLIRLCKSCRAPCLRSAPSACGAIPCCRKVCARAPPTAQSH